MARLNPDLLTTFAIVVRESSFSAAGDILGLTQPAVSLQVRQLEHYFGLRLVERAGKKLRPTPAGETLLTQAERVRVVLDDVQQVMADYSQDVIGSVVLGTGATACIHLMPPLLRELRQDYPRITVGIHTGNTRDIVKAVADNQIDAALVTMPASGRNLVISPLLEDEFVAILNKDCATSPFFDAATLNRLPLIVFESGSSTRSLIDDWFSASGEKNVPVMELGSIEAIKEMVVAGLGYSIIPSIAVTPELLRRGVCAHALTPPLSRTLSIALRQDKLLNKALKIVLNHLEKTALTK
ncbi:LysR family transcriptional regulator [Pectobacteriaceae bacterium CE70]|nr:LysR family transcriptional regulator [Pectobacteriaceae bacterium C52]WJV68013.1 LysR family transcriptional regulator [Pectobacteriaceae bacterium CE70]WJY11955.1 LysR family transcriptional regulator [Pectobacteriaceae bacterium C80]